MVSLRKTLFVVFCTVAALLALVVVLGLMQYRFTHEYDAIIYQGEKLLFRFDTLRESLSRAMISGNAQNIRDASVKIDALNSDLSRLLENTLVPGEFKLALINQVDVSSLSLTASAVAADPGNVELRLQLHDQLRILGENLMQFDRVVTGQMRSRLVRFQGLAIGALTLIIASVSLLVLFLYQKALVPLLGLVQHLQQPIVRDPVPVDPKSCLEVAELADHINKMISEGAYGGSKGEEVAGGFYLSPPEMNRLSNRLTGIINYTQILLDDLQQSVDEEILEMLKNIRDSGERMGTILQKKRGGKKDND
ncbi:MAG: hypothetical protein Kow0089_09530 [Desulfobulbaceae bacterium]